MKKAKISVLICIIGGIGMSFGCTPESTNYSSRDIVSQALAAEEGNLSFYGESTTVTKENDTEVERYVIKEWRSKTGKIRAEMQDANGEQTSITVNDGKSLISYQPKQNQAVVMDDPEMLALNQFSPMDQVSVILEQISETHDLTNGKEEKIAGRKTQHIIAEPQKNNQLLGRQELWIDKENWIVLKMKSILGSQTVEAEYDQIDFDADISDNKFSLKLPEDVEIKNMDELASNREVSLAEAREQMGDSFLYVPEDDEWKRSNVELIEMTGELARTEVSMDYTKNDVPIFNLSVFPTPDDDEEIDQFLTSNEKAITIRGMKGTYTNDDTYRELLWDEKGFRYSLLMMDVTFDLEQATQLAEKMEYLP
ncbi:hypothetical protein AFK71_15835 [Virgibacillus pantothenticus]|uniref:MucB/RseB N-terminal domain-containing protein n=2 Tax=Virgibacillus pantothenticus TaxID=1473 RepID=A0A0L0QMT5_VIRPA|nr:hypothetical protein AFK71_15835 [Virgibacillus pantothenticus]